jgi:hypothetical protein
MITAVHDSEAKNSTNHFDLANAVLHTPSPQLPSCPAAWPPTTGPPCIPSSPRRTERRRAASNFRMRASRRAVRFLPPTIAPTNVPPSFTGELPRRFLLNWPGPGKKKTPSNTPSQKDGGIGRSVVRCNQLHVHGHQRETERHLESSVGVGR